jgi:bleomycin hydrolase
MRESFHTFVLLDVPDNWRRKTDYLNLPLTDFYRVVREAIPAGYSVSLGGDVSEPGLDGHADAAIIPAWDIPTEFINQGSREFRIHNGTTTDDHGVHLVGYLTLAGRDWFLIKDSNRSSRLGQFSGYYFYQGDYIKLKTLAFMVHRDRLAGLLPDG